jgi:drug/metabolite transporter (DMT)-like permease
MQNHNLKGHAAAFFTVIIWGTTFISTKVLLKAFTPLEILFIRFIIGYLTLWLIAPRKLKLQTKKHELLFLASGLCGVTLYFLFENIALNLTLASNVGVIVSIAPIFTAVFAHFFLDGERLKPSFFMGFLTAILGIFLISYNGSAVLKLNPTGDILAILAAIVWGGYSIFSKKISNLGYPTIEATRRIFFYGILSMLPAFFVLPVSKEISRFANPVHLLNLLYLGFGASALCFVTWNLAAKLLGAVKASVYIYIIPVVTVITSVIILKEEITFMAGIGTLLTILGLFLSEKKGRTIKKQINPPSHSGS